MSTTLSLRIDAKTKEKLEALAKISNRSKSFLAAEAIAAYVDAEEWQLDEIRTAIQELDRGDGVDHDQVAQWLMSWGTAGETKAPQ